MSDPKYKNIGEPETKVQEECSEVIKAICKAQRFGWFNYHPDDIGYNNICRIEDEMDDLIETWGKLKQKFTILRKEKRKIEQANQR